MSTSTTTTEAPSATETDETTPPVPEAPEPVTDEQESTEDEQDGDNPSRQAARYRKRAQAAETERDTLAGQVEALQRAEVERAVRSEHRIEPKALWASGAELADLLDGDGVPDPAKIKAAADDAVRQLGLSPKPRNHVPKEGSNPRAASGDSWAGAFKP